MDSMENLIKIFDTVNVDNNNAGSPNEVNSQDKNN